MRYLIILLFIGLITGCPSMPTQQQESITNTGVIVYLDSADNPEEAAKRADIAEKIADKMDTLLTASSNVQSFRSSVQIAAAQVAKELGAKPASAAALAGLSLAFIPDTYSPEDALSDEFKALARLHIDTIKEAVKTWRSFQ